MNSAHLNHDQEQDEAANRLESLREARFSYSVKWQSFIAKTSTHPKALHCFFEGQDAKYYAIRIRALAEAPEFIEYRCGGKDAVCRLHHLISSSHDHKDVAVAFFLDRDFDDISNYPQNENIYLTDGYSIENYYISNEAIKRVVAGEFGLDPLSDEPEIQTVSERCISALTDFIEKSRDLHAWIAAIRDTECTKPANRRLNLASHEISKFIFPSLLNSNRILYFLDDLPQRFGVEAPDSESLSRRQAEFATAEGRIVFRGKWLLDVVRKYLIELRTDRSQMTPAIFSKRGKACLQLSKDNIISELSHYADTPEPLKVFLLRFCRAIAP